MRKTTSMLALVALVAALLATVGSADENAKKKENVEVKIPASAKAVYDATLAVQLANYGRDAKNADALILAARMIAAADLTPSSKSKSPFQPDQKTAKATKDAPTVEVLHTPERLLKEAAHLDTNDRIKDQIKAARKSIAERKRGAQNKPRFLEGSIPANGQVAYNITFRGGERAVVTVHSTAFGAILSMLDPFGNYRVEVLNEKGDVLKSGSGSPVTLSFSPDATKTFTIRITNLDSEKTTFRLTTN